VDLKNRREVEESLERALCATSTELHLQQFPVFHLTPNRPNDTRIVFTERIRENGVVLEREWAVYIQPTFGWPGQQEAEVWRALEHIVHLRQQEGRLGNPFDTSLSEIRKHMAGKGRGGVDLKRIKDALNCLRHTSIKTSFFYDSGEQVRRELGFNLIAELGYHEKTLPNGRRIIDRVSIHFPDKLFENIKNRYVRPIDKGFRDELDKWTAKRLYELLGVKFFALRKRREPYRTRYSRLCGLLGVTRQRYLSRARQVLGRAHQELEERRFVAKVEWYPIRKENDDWVLHYWPGSRARSEWKKDFWRDVTLPEAIFVEQLPQTDAEPVWVEELSPDETTITTAVISDRQVQPMLPFGPDEAGAAAAAAAAAAAGNAQVELPASIEAAAGAAARNGRSGGPEPYAATAIGVFERVTGKHRRLAQLTAAEQRRLAEWQGVGVTAADIEEGIRAALARQAERSQENGRKGREIYSLAYVNGYVRDACARRQSAEQAAHLQALERGAFKLAKLEQGQQVRKAEARFHERFLASEKDRELKRQLLELLVLVQAAPAGAVLLAANAETVELVNVWWRPALTEALGTAVEVLGPAAWVARNHH
jgi:hypothetical protein